MKSNRVWRKNGWVLMNYANLTYFGRTRKDCRLEANAIMIGGAPAADKMFKSGAFEIKKAHLRSGWAKP